ncbi:MAG: FAD-dependent oxidoreductase [Eubacteriaceae bacterium]|nr:FAD-dependent oxidoreductase [Eubacteriaceae bacterium]
MKHYDVLVIGGGIAGISAAKALDGLKVLLVEKSDRLGGILNQCLHRGFGKDMTGPEYISGILSDFPENINVALKTAVTDITPQKTATLRHENSTEEISFSELILATGCMERPTGHMLIAGSRPEGVYTAGQVQEMINIHGIIPPSPAVILGSGDIGLIVAKHLFENNVEVTIVEIKDQLGGLARNRMWLEGYDVKIMINTTVKKILGEESINGVVLTDGTHIPAKTLIAATGLIPDREILKYKNYPFEIHICGNCKEVFPMVEGVARDAERAANAAIENIRRNNDR